MNFLFIVIFMLFSSFALADRSLVGEWYLSHYICQKENGDRYSLPLSPILKNSSTTFNFSENNIVTFKFEAKETEYNGNNTLLDDNSRIFCRILRTGQYSLSDQSLLISNIEIEANEGCGINKDAEPKEVSFRFFIENNDILYLGAPIIEIDREYCGNNGKGFQVFIRQRFK